MTRVLLHVQHLLGTGHLRRAAAIAAALPRQGFTVELVSGGLPIADLDVGGASLVQLPPARARDETFRALVDAEGRAVDAAWRAARRAALLAQFARFDPDVVITELFPLGRRILSFELVPLIEAARARRPRPLILASVRDILVPTSDPAKIDEMVARVTGWYDHVLVHGDPALIPLAASFPEHRIADHVVYTGYVAAHPGVGPSAADGQDEIIVSCGGGAVGANLMRAAVAARPLSDSRHRRWRLLIGGDLDAAARGELAAAACPGLVVEPARPDFPSLLARCHVSVSQSGYNTAMDVLTARARAVFVPFASGQETEQTLRAEAFARRGWARLVAEAELSPVRLARAIDEAGASRPPDPNAIRCDGADEAGRLIRAWLERPSARV